MSNYNIAKIYPNDRFANAQIEKLLQDEGIRRDPNLDYTCGMYDEDMNIIATGSLFGNTLRCMAVSHLHQGEGLMNEIVTHLIEIQFERGNTHLFLYTKCDTAKFFGDLGFSEIARVSDQLVFMENRRTGFSDYLKKLQNSCTKNTPSSDNNIEYSQNTQNIAALVMNANPFTNGHLYLVEKLPRKMIFCICLWSVRMQVWCHILYVRGLLWKQLHICRISAIMTAVLISSAMQPFQVIFKKTNLLLSPDMLCWILPSLNLSHRHCISTADM